MVTQKVPVRLEELLRWRRRSCSIKKHQSRRSISVRKEKSAAILQIFTSEVVNLIMEDFQLEDRYAARLINKSFSKMIPAADPDLIDVLVDRMWSCPDRVSMQTGRARGFVDGEIE